jgi:hypothetical protein
MLIIPDLGERERGVSDPSLILAFVADNIPHAGLATVLRVEDRLHDRLRILREREQPCDEIRDALALCAARRAELAAAGNEASGAPSPHSKEDRQHV